MLNWRLEEREYVGGKVDEYYKSISGLQRIFISEKQMNKNIDYITEQARLEYRSKKLDGFLDEVNEERKRIEKAVEDLNNKLNKYLEEQKALIEKEVEPFEIEVKPYDNFTEQTLRRIELVTIHLKPMKVCFAQEKID